MKFLLMSKFLMILILPFLLFLIVLNFSAFDMDFYQKKFLEYKVHKEVVNADSLHKDVIDFINGKNDELPSEFNEREKKHLFDVRRIIRVSKILLYTSIILFIFLLALSSFSLKINAQITHFIGEVFVFGGLLTIALAALLSLFISLDFSVAFDSFHSLFFEKGTYEFDPAKEIIVKLYPEQLFMDLGIRISKWILLISAITILVGGFLSFKSKKQKNK